MNLMVKNIGLSINPIIAMISPSSKKIAISHQCKKTGIPIIL